MENVELSLDVTDPQPGIEVSVLPPRKRNPELRLTVVDTIYYQQPGFDTPAYEVGYSKFLQSNEQLYLRRGFMNEEEKPLEYGWIQKAVCVVIQNTNSTQGRSLSGEEKEALQKIELGVRFKDSEHWMMLGMKESMRFRTDPRNLIIRSFNGLCRFTCIIVPE